jgi:hypothetical protein
MKLSVLLFSLLISLGVMSTIFSNSVSSLTENNTVLSQAQKSLDANQKKITTVTPEPILNDFSGINGTSNVQGVYFTWVIISSENEISVNLRYDGNGQWGYSAR